MKLDNFTTARCSKCHWVKQFQPGREYEPKEFECNCGKVIEPPKRIVPKKPKPKQATMEAKEDADSRQASKENSEG